MRTGLTALLIVVLTTSLAAAQPTGAPHDKSHPVIWTIVGAGGGFALGTFVGLKVFDDDVESEQKVWGTAVACAAGGAIAAFLLSRQHSPRRHPTVGPLTEAEVRALSSQFPRRAPRASRPNLSQPSAAAITLASP